MSLKLHFTDCLRSFRFGAIDARRSDIALAYSDTCDWLFTTAKFREWKQPASFHAHKGVLWIKGKPGAGKSTLMKHTLLHCQTDDFFRGYLCVAYFFNARGETLEKTPLGMLLSIVYQLLKNESGDVLYRRILPSYREKHTFHRNEPWQWRQSELQEFIRLAVQQFRSQPLLILADALDECVESDVRDVVAFLETLSNMDSRGAKPLKICLASRHYPSIQMRRFQQLTVEKCSDHDDDIAKYLVGHLRINDPIIQSEIQRRAEGVFFWVVIIVSLLNKAFDEGRVELIPQELREAPSDLEDLFLAILGRKSAGVNTPIAPETVLTLLWVLLSKRPLRPDELCAAVVGTTPPAPSLVHRRIDTLSKGLVEVRDGKKVQFIHLSLKDFLVRNGRLQTLDPSLGLDPVKASHGRLWARCWATIKKADPADPLLHYAYTYIVDHAEYALGNNTEAWETLTSFERLQEPGAISETPEEVHIRRWMQESDCWFLQWRYHRHLRSHRSTAKSNELTMQEIETTATLPYLLASGGFTRLLISVLDSLDPDARIVPLGTALRAASYHGQQEMARLLITRGADVHMHGRYFKGRASHGRISFHRMYVGSALSAASSGGHSEIARLLIENGADINASFQSGDTALHIVSAAGNCKLVVLLLMHGADINARNEDGETALHISSKVARGPTHDLEASTHDFEACVGLLIDKGADMNTQNENGETALHLASKQAHEAIVGLLIRNGADVNTRNEDGETALQLASKRAREEQVRLLMNTGDDAWPDLALQYNSVVKLLRKNGATDCPVGIVPVRGSTSGTGPLWPMAPPATALGLSG